MKIIYSSPQGTDAFSWQWGGNRPGGIRRTGISRLQVLHALYVNILAWYIWEFAGALDPALSASQGALHSFRGMAGTACSLNCMNYPPSSHIMLGMNVSWWLEKLFQLLLLLQMDATWRSACQDCALQIKGVPSSAWGIWTHHTTKACRWQAGRCLVGHRQVILRWKSTSEEYYELMGDAHAWRG